MTELHSERLCEPLPVFCLGCGPMSSAYPLSVDESHATLRLQGQFLVSAMTRGLGALRGRRRSASRPSVRPPRGGGASAPPGSPRRLQPVTAVRPQAGTAWQIHLLHVAGLLIITPLLPLLLLARLMPGRANRYTDENIFAEANRSVLTAIDYALMA
jgi:hypothetical protein